MTFSKINGEIYKPIPKKDVGSRDYAKIEELLADKGLMEKLVENDPNEAIRLFNIRGDCSVIGLGEMIRDEYEFDPEYEGTVRDIKSRIKNILLDSVSE